MAVIDLLSSLILIPRPLCPLLTYRDGVGFGVGVVVWGSDIIVCFGVGVGSLTFFFVLLRKSVESFIYSCKDKVSCLSVCTPNNVVPNLRKVNQICLNEKFNEKRMKARTSKGRLISSDNCLVSSTSVVIFYCFFLSFVWLFVCLFVFFFPSFG